ncbi:MAG TPA: CsgG/HfaB family protein [Candidatus Sulfopaludibacter sp.]|jgi:curli biogenesis system outer membrane secretion channel CsgG|nr:CsgG/HfaB family protein [Candidatus Sulfopaludibacter sp.]
MRTLITGFVLFFTISASLQAQHKKRVAVMNFDYGTVQTDVQALFGTNKDIGAGITDLLVDKLVQDGVFSVIERKELDKIIKEQNFSNSDRADASSAAKIARILGVDGMIIGSITQFGRDDKSTAVGGGALGNVTGRFGLGGVKKSESNAVVQITARIIDTSTAEILASASGKGESTRKGAGLMGAGGSAYGPEAGLGIDMKSSNFAATIIGEATGKAVQDLGGKLEASASRLPTVVIQVSGTVADASPDGTLIINVGSKAGLKVGDKLDVKRAVRTITDPTTGKVLRKVEDMVGQLTITEVDEGSAVGKFSGPGKPQVNDSVSTSK